jgi:hypothetical protein
VRYLAVSLVILGVAIAQAEPQTRVEGRVLAPAYQHGAAVSVRAVDGLSASPPVQRVVAIPGDRIRIDQSGVYL